MGGRPTASGPDLSRGRAFDRLRTAVRRFRQTGTPVRLVRWWIVGVVALGADLGAIYVAHELLGMALPIAALVAGEAVQLVRFLAVDRWVFGHTRPTWTRLWQYHVACFSATVLHWLVLNGLAWVGLHYLLATIAATGVTVSWSMLTNFLWVWRRRGAHAPATPRAPLASGPSRTGV